MNELLRETAASELEANPEAARFASEVLGSESPLFWEVYSQYAQEQPRRIEDAYYIWLLNRWVERGYVLQRTFKVDMPPFQDGWIEENNSVLTRLEDAWKGRVRATFAPTTGPSGGSDGLIRWTVPAWFIKMREDTSAMADNEWTGEMSSVLVQPWQVPLEVGTCPASRTIFRLMRNWGVARWPYEHDEISVFIQSPAWRRISFPEVKWMRTENRLEETCRRRLEVRRFATAYQEGMDGDEARPFQEKQDWLHLV